MQPTRHTHYKNIITADSVGIAHACDLLKSGRLVAFPTETVYGLGADATNDRACASIYEAKGRPSFNPLIVHFPTPEEAEKRVIFTETAHQLSKAFWPGPMTLVLPRQADCDIATLCSAGLDSLAIRVPGHSIAHELLTQSSLPLAAPSANASGKISPTKAEHVANSLGEAVSCILDTTGEAEEACAVGLESTVIDLTGDIPVLLRPGNLTKEDIQAVVGPIQLGQSLMEAKAEEDGLKSPGLLKSHYAPSHLLRLDATEVNEQEALLAFGSSPIGKSAHLINLSEGGDLGEAAANLFSALHDLDKLTEITGIAVMPIPNEGLGLAINDRLRRAAAPRP